MYEIGRNISLRQLRYFETLARTTHFGKAAEACAISQPALSMQIKELEHTLGALLFERNKRQIHLTEFGEKCALHARHILQSVDALADLAQAQNHLFTGKLRLGIIPTIAPYLLPTIMAELNTTFEELEIYVRESQTHKLVAELLDNKLDIVLVALPISEPALQEMSLFEEKFVLARPAQEANLPVPDAQTLAKMKLLLLEEGHCFRDQALSFCDLSPDTHKARPQELLDAGSLSTLTQMVSAGLGVTLLPEMAVPVETKSANVSVCIFKPPQPSRLIGLAWRKTHPRGHQFTQIGELVQHASYKMLRTIKLC